MSKQENLKMDKVKRKKPREGGKLCTRKEKKDPFGEVAMCSEITRFLYQPQHQYCFFATSRLWYICLSMDFVYSTTTWRESVKSNNKKWVCCCTGTGGPQEVWWLVFNVLSDIKQSLPIYCSIHRIPVNSCAGSREGCWNLSQLHSGKGRGPPGQVASPVYCCAAQLMYTLIKTESFKWWDE